MGSKGVSGRPSLLQFLHHARQAHLQNPFPSPQAGAASHVYVLGNPSADLDSIISAIVYSYFASKNTGDTSPGTRPGTGARQYIPIINLHDVPAGQELKRLRPEFATALHLSTNPGVGGKIEWHNDSQQGSQVLQNHLLTVADLRALHEHDKSRAGTGMDLVMVDWNALPTVGEKKGRGIDGISDVLPDLKIRVVGCVDHHTDEGFIPSSGSLPAHYPRVIQMGVGSCASLVVRELRSQGLWHEGSVVGGDLSSEQADAQPVSQEAPRDNAAAIFESQLAKLALAAILIDTANMTAKDKVSDVDRSAVRFLEDKIQQGQEAWEQRGVQIEGWDRPSFYEQIQHAKVNSLDGLTIAEVLGRDYKEWTVSASSDENTRVKMGICSVVKPLSWIAAKAQEQPHGQKSQEGGTRRSDSDNTFHAALQAFAESKGLGLLSVMTAFSSGQNGSFQRELLVWALNDTSVKAAEKFIEMAGKLQLEEFASQKNSSGAVSFLPTINVGWRQAWHQNAVAMSRKQVAPLLMEAVAKL